VNLLPVHVDGSSGSLKVFPYHKSVQDWLVDPSPSGGRVDVSAGHAHIARACTSSIAAGHASRADTRSIAAGGASTTGTDSMHGYALRFGGAHLCEAGMIAALEELVLDFVYFWPEAYAAGVGGWRQTRSGRGFVGG
jgi:hypothetical protein